MQQVTELAQARGVDVLTPRRGEAVILDGSNTTTAWWRAQNESAKAARFAVTGDPSQPAELALAP